VHFHPLSFDQHNTYFGDLYKKLVDQLTKKPDYIFIVPEMTVGGTEKLLFNYLLALRKVRPKWHIAVLSKLPDKHPFEVPDDVDFIDFEGVIGSLGGYERNVVWSRFLIQSKAKRIHIINHEWAYSWVATHQELLQKNNFIINLSLFMREFTLEPGRFRSFSDPQISDIYPVVNKIFTDNQNVIDEVLQANGYDEKRLIVHYQPVYDKIKKPRLVEKKSSRPLKILWASRLSQQKRPDILRKIGENINPALCTIDVYGREQHYRGNYFSGVNSVNYKGEFNGLDSIPLEEYDAFLYTSDVDGMPNVLLEIVCRGLVVIASNDGGVRELIKNKKTGLLVEIEDIEGYVKAIKHLKDNPSSRHDYAISAQKLLKIQHNPSEFEKLVDRDFN
jgi:glycosyltransferase involved in cell wall biosynthesis